MDRISLILVIIGSLNWGSIGLFRYDFITALFGTTISAIVFLLVGLAGLWCIRLLFREHEEVSRRDHID